MLLKECLTTYQAFQKLSALNLPLKSSWMIAQNLKKLEPIAVSFEESRTEYIKLLQTKATTDKNGDPEVSEELAAEFRTQVESLLEEDQDLKLKKVVIEDKGDLNIEPAVLMGAMDYITIK